MIGFVGWLENMGKKDTRVRAVLRRSLTFDPGTYGAAYPFVEPFVKDEANSWRRAVFYLVAGLWASHWREGRSGSPVSIGEACAAHQRASGSSSVERRFINLLDADSDQLPNRLRQMISLLKEQAIDFQSLLNGLLLWNDERKRTQNRWARDFYRHWNVETDAHHLPTEKEI